MKKDTSTVGIFVHGTVDPIPSAYIYHQDFVPEYKTPDLTHSHQVNNPQLRNMSIGQILAMNKKKNHCM